MKPAYDVVSLYQKMVLNPEAASFRRRFPINRFWEENVLALEKFMAEGPERPQLVHQAQKTFFFSVNVPSEQKNYAVEWLLDEQRGRNIDLFSLPKDIQESEWSYEENNVIVGGRRLTPDFLRTVSIANQIALQPKMGSAKLSVIELGAGLGHLARTLRLMGVAKQHAIVDLPETLVFSYSFLSLNFPDASIALVTTEFELAQALGSRYDFLLIPVYLADRLAGVEFDLFLNTASLGEMPNQTIRYWMHWLQSVIQPKSLFTLNRFLNTMSPVHHNWRWDENECSLLYDERWEIYNWQLEPAYTRCPYVDPLIARYVEVFARRCVSSATHAEQESRADDILRRLAMQDWWLYRDRDPTMTMASNVLAPDLGMRGTLFLLWDQIRTRPSALAYAMMLRYLRCLITEGQLQFEEEDYFRRRFLETASDDQKVSPSDVASVKLMHKQSHPPTVELVLPGKTHNIVKADDKFIALSLSLGQVNAMQDIVGVRDLGNIVLVDTDLENLKRRIADMANNQVAPHFRRDTK